MATNDFVQDLVEKLTDDNMEYLVIALQKGKEEHKANAYYSIRTTEGAEMMLATVREIFESEGVVDLIPIDELDVEGSELMNPDNGDEDDEEDDDHEEGANQSS